MDGSMFMGVFLQQVRHQDEEAFNWLQLYIVLHYSLHTIKGHSHCPTLNYLNKCKDIISFSILLYLVIISIQNPVCETMIGYGARNI